MRPPRTGRGRRPPPPRRCPRCYGPAGVLSPVPPIVSVPKSRASTEVAVGQKWFLGIGVFVLLLAAGFFLKYAFDEKWIGPAMQVTLGFVAGALLFVGGEICRRRKFLGLYISLAAFALGVLYLSVSAATQIYPLIPAALTMFVILLLI